jgi:uncharacterized protein YdhG (YjbR/CyaY superfamily)
MRYVISKRRQGSLRKTAKEETGAPRSHARVAKVGSEDSPDRSSRSLKPATGGSTPANFDEYIAAFSPEVRAILERIRRTIHNAAPGAQEAISYRIPAFRQGGILVYFAAFKNHIGFYPPVSGDPSIEKAIAPYAGEKGNLRFPLDQPIPYRLIERIVKLRVKQSLAKSARSV